MFFSEENKQFKSYTRRSLFVIFFKLIFFFFVGFKIFNIQIKESEKYKTLSKKNRINLKILFPNRGIILDRNNKILATNQIAYNLYIVPEQVDNIGDILRELSKIIKITFKQRKKTISLSKKVKKFEMIKIVDDLSWSQLEDIETNIFKLNGVHLLSTYKRKYLYDNQFSHIIGYTSQPSEKDLELPYISSMPTLDIGATGVEKYFNKKLIGIPGNKEVEVNAFGREIREISRIKSTEGEKIHLSLDYRIQEIIHKEFKNIKSGSAVAINVNSGEIIGMVSIPDFDPNRIINKPNQKYWSEILNNPLAKLSNRAIQGLYAPGSTFKMVVALAGLEKGVIDLKSNIFCSGKIEFGERFYHCWKTKGHAKVDLMKAIKESCDCYFYDLAQKIGVNDIAKMARKLGLGKLTNIELPAEKKGVVPDIKWKKNNLKESWYAGETLITGIGQGYLLATPLQMALMTAQIANGGKKINPTLIKKSNFEDVDLNPIEINNEHLKIIQKGMFKVVNEPYGTAFGIKSDSKKYILAGKTGTSQVKRITVEERESEDFRKKELEWKDKDHSLFVGYAPAKNPKFAVSVVVEHGGSGAKVAAPIAKNIFDGIYKLEI